MDIVYEILDAFHVFIPVVAIVACVIIFVCGIRSSKSAQPPDEYLQQIKNASKNKARHKTSKWTTQTSVASSPKADHSPSADKSPPKSSPSGGNNNVTESKREKAKVETPATNKKPKKLTKKDSDEKEAEAVEASEWVTVTPKRKQQQQHKDGTLSTSAVNTPTTPDLHITEQIGKKSMIDDDYEERSDKPTEKKIETPKTPKKKNKEPMENSVVEETKQAKGDISEQVMDVHQSLDAAIEDDESWSVQTGKDSRYRKSKRREGPMKNDVIENFSNSHVVSSPESENNSSDQQQSNETRRRRNVRREN